jgi:succinate dehydrogenase hydrophobic anchor subunit
MKRKKSNWVTIHGWYGFWIVQADAIKKMNPKQYKKIAWCRSA